MRILVIEDDLEFCEMLAFALGEEGYTVDVCNEGDDGLRWMGQRAHDLVLLDRMLPRLDGGTLVRKVREAGITTPVLMMTALGGVDDRIEGLDLGADDYIVKPFHVGELLARVRALARRPRTWDDAPVIRHGDLVLDPLQKTLSHGSKVVTLSRKETDLLGMLLKNPGVILPRSAIFAHVWGPDAAVEDGNLDNYIHFVRQRLKAVDSPMEIETVRYSGYRLKEKAT